MLEIDGLEADDDACWEGCCIWSSAQCVELPPDMQPPADTEIDAASAADGAVEPLGSTRSPGQLLPLKLLLTVTLLLPAILG
jgi:hypothetical protein